MAQCIHTNTWSGEESYQTNKHVQCTLTIPYPFRLIICDLMINNMMINNMMINDMMINDMMISDLMINKLMMSN